MFIAHAVRDIIVFWKLGDYVGCNFMSIGELVKPMTCKIHDTFLTDFPEKSIKQLMIQLAVRGHFYITYGHSGGWVVQKMAIFPFFM